MAVFIRKLIVQLRVNFYFFFPLCFISAFPELSSVDMIQFAPPRTAGLTNKGYDLSSDLSKGEIGRLSSRIFVSHDMFCLQIGSN